MQHATPHLRACPAQRSETCPASPAARGTAHTRRGAAPPATPATPSGTRGSAPAPWCLRAQWVGGGARHVLSTAAGCVASVRGEWGRDRRVAGLALTSWAGCVRSRTRGLAARGFRSRAVEHQQAAGGSGRPGRDREGGRAAGRADQEGARTWVPVALGASAQQEDGLGCCGAHPAHEVIGSRLGIVEPAAEGRPGQSGGTFNSGWPHVPCGGGGGWPGRAGRASRAVGSAAPRARLTGGAGHRPRGAFGPGLEVPPACEPEPRALLLAANATSWAGARTRSKCGTKPMRFPSGRPSWLLVALADQTPTCMLLGSWRIDSSVCCARPSGGQRPLTAAGVQLLP